MGKGLIEAMPCGARLTGVAYDMRDEVVISPGDSDGYMYHFKRDFTIRASIIEVHSDTITLLSGRPTGRSRVICEVSLKRGTLVEWEV